MSAVLLALLTLSGCAKIASFEQPYMQEVFMGSLAITPALRGLFAAGRATAALTINGNGTGQTVALYGIPKNEGFPLWPQFDPLDPPPTVAGFEAEVLGPNQIKVIGFSDMNDAAAELDLEVTGQIVREGPKLATLRDHPIIISIPAKKLKGLPAAFISKIRRMPGEIKLDEIDDSEMIPLYQIKFVGQVTSIF